MVINESISALQGTVSYSKLSQSEPSDQIKIIISKKQDDRKIQSTKRLTCNSFLRDRFGFSYHRAGYHTHIGADEETILECRRSANRRRDFFWRSLKHKILMKHLESGKPNWGLLHRSAYNLMNELGRNTESFLIEDLIYAASLMKPVTLGFYKCPFFLKTYHHHECDMNLFYDPIIIESTLHYEHIPHPAFELILLSKPKSKYIFGTFSPISFDLAAVKLLEAANKNDIDTMPVVKKETNITSITTNEEDYESKHSSDFSDQEESDSEGVYESSVSSISDSSDEDTFDDDLNYQAKKPRLTI